MNDKYTLVAILLESKDKEEFKIIELFNKLSTVNAVKKLFNKGKKK